MIDPNRHLRVDVRLKRAFKSGAFPKRLLICGPAGTGKTYSILLFLHRLANANAGLDWPVRLLVFENDKGEVWTAYTDFDWIARRHGIKNRGDQFKMASTVIGSITSSVKSK